MKDLFLWIFLLLPIHPSHSSHSADFPKVCQHLPRAQSCVQAVPLHPRSRVRGMVPAQPGHWCSEGLWCVRSRRLSRSARPRCRVVQLSPGLPKRKNVPALGRRTAQPWKRAWAGENCQDFKVLEVLQNQNDLTVWLFLNATHRRFFIRFPPAPFIPSKCCGNWLLEINTWGCYTISLSLINF